jgi:diguanylate cyclase (GGDEF)-like protein
VRTLPGSHRTGARLYLTATHVAAALGLCALLCLVSAVWPPSAVTPVPVWYAASAALAVVAAGVLAARRHPRSPLVALVVAVLVGAALVGTCRTLAGVVTTSLGLVAAGQGAALLGDQRTVRRVLGLIVVALAAGMLASPVPFHALTWVVVATATVAMSALVSVLLTRLRLLATTDDLTGALTRAAFDERATLILHGAARRGRAVSVVCLDVDDFKAVNDTRGHQAGDEVLVRLVGAWREGLGRDDVLGRIGGDEFAVVLTGRTADGAEAWARGTGALRGPDDPTWSHGVAQVRADEPVRDALARADSAMYASKGRRAEALG